MLWEDQCLMNKQTIKVGHAVGDKQTNKVGYAVGDKQTNNQSRSDRGR